MHILVTGANGYIGRALVESLQNKEFELNCLVRSISSSSVNCAKRISLDITPETNWNEVLTGLEAVVHLADDSRPFEKMKRPADKQKQDETANKTLHLARCAAEAGVKKFIYMSSIKAVSNEWQEGTLKEGATPPANHSVYGQIKWQIEQSLLELGQSYGMKIIILRPPVVYGQHSKGNFQQLLKLSALPYPLPFAGFTAKRSMVALENLCGAIETVLRQDCKKSGTYFICDKEPISVAQILETGRSLHKKPARLFKIPGFGLLAVMPVTKGIMDRLAKPLVVSGERFCEDFNWQPPLTVHEGLAKAMKIKNEH